MNGQSKFSRIRRRHKLLGLFRMLRIPNLLMIATGQILCGFYLLQNPWWNNQTEIWHFFLLVAASMAAAAGGYVINDYYDVKIDVLNKPKRVVIGKLISRRKAMFTHLAFVAISLFCSYFLGRKIFFVVAFCCLWLWVYSNALKRLPFIGNFSVSVLTSVSIFLPSLAFGPAKQELYLFCLFAFWISLIREIVKDMEDIRGDARHGCQTIPIIWGIRKTKSLIYGVAILFFITYCFASLYMPNLWIFSSLILAVPIFYLFAELKKADTTKAFNKVSKICKWTMIAGMSTILLV